MLIDHTIDGHDISVSPTSVEVVEQVMSDLTDGKWTWSQVIVPANVAHETLVCPETYHELNQAGLVTLFPQILPSALQRMAGPWMTWSATGDS